MIPLEPLKPAIEAAVREAGHFIRQESLSFNTSKAEKKGSNDLVSYVDRGAEDLLKSRFDALLPGSGYINEEGGDTPSENGWRWIIDPLDGTTNFVHGVSNHAVSVALQWEEETVLAYVYELVRDELFFAEKGKGATLNGKAIQVSGAPHLGEGLIATGFPYVRSGRIPAIMAVLGEFLEQCRGIRRLGSAACDLCYVACGRYDGYYENWVNSWDIAAGVLIVQEAGGKISDFQGTDKLFIGRQVAASNGQIHQEMLAILSKWEVAKAALL